MATTTIRRIPIVYALLAFFFLQISSSTDIPPEQSPSPSPQQSDLPFLSPPPLLPPPSPSPGTGSPSPDTGSPSPTTLASPPSPPPSDLTVPVPAPDEDVPAPAPDEDVPAPAPTEASDINVDGGSGGEEEEEGEESEGMSGGKKAGIAVGVIMAACLVGFGGLVYKKRQDNIRRTAYGHAARRELL